MDREGGEREETNGPRSGAAGPGAGAQHLLAVRPLSTQGGNGSETAAQAGIRGRGAGGGLLQGFAPAVHGASSVALSPRLLDPTRSGGAFSPRASLLAPRRSLVDDLAVQQGSGAGAGAGRSSDAAGGGGWRRPGSRGGEDDPKGGADGLNGGGAQQRSSDGFSGAQGEGAAALARAQGHAAARSCIVCHCGCF